MSQVNWPMNGPTRRPGARASWAPLAVLLLGAGTAAQAGVVMSPHGMPAGAAQMTAAERSRCIEIEEAPGRGRTGARFVATWSRDSSCAGTAAEAAAPPAAPRAGSADTPAPTSQGTPPAAPAVGLPQTPASPSGHSAPAAPTAPPVVMAAAAPAPSSPSSQSSPPAPTSAFNATPSPDTPAPPAPPAPATPRDSAPLQSPSAESAPPEIGVLSPEQPPPSGPGNTPGFGLTTPANELTGIGPRPIGDPRPTPPGTIPEPSSLWLLALGLAGALWRPRRR